MLEISEERRKELLRIACPDWIEPLKPTGHALRTVTPKKGFKGRPRSKKKIKAALLKQAYYWSHPEYRTRNKSILPPGLPRRAKITLT